MKVLLVRLSSMGDLIHTLPAVDDLSRFCPGVELHWLCEAGFADIARLHPFVKKVHTMRWRQWRKQLAKKETWREICRLKADLRQEHYDFVLDSQGLMKSALFAKMAGVAVKGLDNASAREGLAAWFYRQGYAVPKGRNAVWRNRALFGQVFGYDLPDNLHFGLVVPDAGRLQTDLRHPYCVALHATSRDSKLWPVGHWIGLLEKLHTERGCAVYLPWGNEAERHRAEQIAAKLPFAEVCGKMNLLQAAYLLRHAQGVAGVDTGLLHLANALDTPVVGIFTDTDPVKTGVQESVWARNIGNAGQIPAVDEVYKVLAECIVAKQSG
ncbi:lipopolysaccharide heptosyltransferase I [Neisseria animalis]|uniref:Lipopolysaccharide heptosyltransferase 1 n=1 Tax=Neisseria animalis TaxID=492 RepID=A0A5P3MQM0_NEIAN|nr:lipopolysaccharide heptosyltransferase I [Neisseria animalis]QEY23897.1 lipopolysaccharide heptosyltransferase I [Neisseria animalis]ROW32035.1 lipopolysaccharide heptosyltransferase I [Neisseria animalis]VEE05817.1 lipopolysaccharide heptosyltransferase I [Neisseria animalis]